MNEYFKKRWRYYNNTAVQFELIKAMRDREVVFMDRKDNWKCIRGLSIKSIKYLNQAFNVYNFFEKDYNIYISVAKYNHIPPFTYDLAKRSEETREWFENHAEKEIYHYNTLLDFDSKFLNDNREIIENRDTMIMEIYKALQYFDEPFYMIPSGNNFQIVGINPAYKSCSEVGEKIKNFKTTHNLRHLDLSGVGHRYKLMKTPFSLVGEISVLPMRFISMPFLLNYRYFDCNNILKKETMYRYGIHIHNMRGDTD